MDILRDDDDNKPLVIISGWSDGAIRRYHLDDVPYDSHITLELNAGLANDFPRNVVFLNATTTIVHMNSGQLLKIDQHTQGVFYDGRETLKNGYAKMLVAKDGEKYLAVGALDGSMIIFDQHGSIVNEFQIKSSKNNKILQILWLNNTASSKLLVCIPDGIMVRALARSASMKTSSHVFVPCSLIAFITVAFLLSFGDGCSFASDAFLSS